MGAGCSASKGLSGNAVAAKHPPARGRAPTALELRFATRVRIPDAHLRCVTLRDLREVRAHVRAVCAAEQWTGLRPDEDGEAGAELVARELAPDEVTLHELSERLIRPATEREGCALAELLADGPRAPLVYLSHPHAHPFSRTVEVIEQHMADRGYSEDDPIWLDAFALRQPSPGEEGTAAPLGESAFYLALRQAKLTLALLGEGAGLANRMWCGLEAALSFSKSGALTDLYAAHNARVVRLTDGVIAADRPADGEEAAAFEKRQRDRCFPLALVAQAVRFTLRGAEATCPPDRAAILAHAEAAGGEALLDATYRARCFLAVLPLLAGSSDPLAAGGIDLSAGFAALRASPHVTDMRLHELAPALVAPLVGSLPRGLVSLALHSGRVEEEQVGVLAAYLATSRTLRSLCLSGNNIGYAGGAALAQALQANSALTLLDLGYNQLDSDGAASLAAALRANGACALRELRLYRNSVGPTGGAALGAALEVNTSLTKLDLGFNRLGSDGTFALANALAANATLRSLCLRRNGIDEEGGESLHDALAANASLRWLDLGGNEIGDEGVAALREPRAHNPQLQIKW